MNKEKMNSIVTLFFIVILAIELCGIIIGSSKGLITQYEKILSFMVFLTIIIKI